MQIASLTTTPPAGGDAAPLQDRLEQAFLEEMLKYCNPQASKGSFAGGHGEEHFSSFLNQEYARLLSARLDLRLGELR
ncbi:hypothetical protein [Paracoccus saliphilus]|uniref:Rod binding protein n=1 Tax=Paracoccus saliphilus TaxID=405559 RepID=A0AA45W1H2_9RHOB|nr:hypothetical protein [Paracoccus saliphilus]WCR03634.1 hypothetical protein JHX88_02330 [Paracoccus saliphilus]SIS57017.1 hypothetical protein SAMN05421772_101542 [Paracoccus saliphilus]